MKVGHCALTPYHGIIPPFLTWIEAPHKKLTIHNSGFFFFLCFAILLNWLSNINITNPGENVHENLFILEIHWSSFSAKCRNYERQQAHVTEAPRQWCFDVTPDDHNFVYRNSPKCPLQHIPQLNLKFGPHSLPSYRNVNSAQKSAHHHYCETLKIEGIVNLMSNYIIQTKQGGLRCRQFFEGKSVHFISLKIVFSSFFWKETIASVPNRTMNHNSLTRDFNEMKGGQKVTESKLYIDHLKNQNKRSCILTVHQFVCVSIRCHILMCFTGWRYRWNC